MLSQKHKRWRIENKVKILQSGKKYRRENKAKISQSGKNYRAKNKEKNLQRLKKYRRENKAKISQQRKEYYRNNKAKMKDYFKKYRADNKARISQSEKRYRADNKARISQRYKRWREQNKDKRKKYQKEHSQTPRGRSLKAVRDARYMAKKKQLIHSFTVEEWQQKLKDTFGVCPDCDKFCGINKLQLDHIIPISQAEPGQIYTIDDIQPLCQSCNKSKGTTINIMNYF